MIYRLVKKWRLILTITASTSVIFLIIQSTLLNNQTNINYADLESPHGDPIFIYKSYIDARNSSAKPKLRILAIKNCLLNTETKLYGEITLKNGRKIFKRRLNLVHLNSHTCPWRWAPNCSLSPHYVQVELPVKDVSTIQSMQICRGTGQSSCHHIEPITVRSTPAIRHQLIVCVLPMYLYSDVSMIIIFIETWLKLGATKFLIYYTSATKDVLQLLQAYEDQNVLEIIPWPVLPKIYSQNFDPNSQLYRFGHYLAINDCIFRTAPIAKYVAPVDFDEYIIPANFGAVPDNNNLVTFLNSKFIPKHNSVKFTHRRVYYNSSLRYSPKKNSKFDVSHNFEWLDDLWVNSEKKGPTKFIFRPNMVDILNNHEVHSPSNNYQPISSRDAVLYHIRTSHILTKNITKTDKFRFLSEIKPEIVRKFQKLARKHIKLNRLVTNWAEIGSKVSGCLSKWTDVGCKIPHTMCETLINANADRFRFVNDSFPSETFDVI